MKVGKVVRTVKAPERRTQKAGEKQKPIPVYIPTKQPKKVEVGQ